MRTYIKVILFVASVIQEGRPALLKFFRYEIDYREADLKNIEKEKDNLEIEESFIDVFKHLGNLSNNKFPNSTTYNIAKWGLCLFSK